MRNGQKSRLDKLAKEVEVEKNGKKEKTRIILEEKEEIEKEVTSFFTNLFHGFHSKNGSIADKPFTPDFTDLPYQTCNIRQKRPSPNTL